MWCHAICEKARKNIFNQIFTSQRLWFWKSIGIFFTFLQSTYYILYIIVPICSISTFINPSRSPIYLCIYIYIRIICTYSFISKYDPFYKYFYPYMYVLGINVSRVLFCPFVRPSNTLMYRVITKNTKTLIT